MSRYNTQVLSNIRMLCRMQNIDEKVLYERAKLILSIYREVCWSTIDRANDVCDTLICTYGDSLDGALIYLENFAPDEARERFEERIRSLFETKWIIELVDMAMLKIREYPDKGALYCEIISKAYLNRFKYRESEMLEVLNMERSTYYDRKKEAILLFGLSLWGTAIPKLKDFLESAREEEALCYCEYSMEELGQRLGLKEATAYELVAKGHFDVVDVLGKRRVTKESFERWYASQTDYRTVEDQELDADIMASTYGLPEMARMLGVHRQTIYYIVANEDFELIKVGRYKRATKESFEKWYHNQTRYQLAEDRQERS